MGRMSRVAYACQVSKPVARIRSIRRIFFVVLLLVIACIWQPDRAVYASEPFKFHVLDVGQGQSVLIESDNHYMLIDGGGRGASSFVVSYLKQQGIECLDYIAVSHYDEDHMAGLIGVLKVFSCDTLFVPSYEGEGELYQSFTQAAMSNGCLIIHVTAGMSFLFGSAEGIIVGPVRTDYTAENNHSICFQISCGDKKFLICGDAEQESEADIASSGLDMKSDLYVVNHHGSSTSSSDVFLDTVAPAYAVISCGCNNAYGHPSVETMQRLQNHGITMFRTDEQGTVIAYSDGKSLWFNVNPSYDWAGGGSSTLPSGLNNDAQSDTAAMQRIPAQEGDYQYVCNMNTKKFHYPDCSSVNQMNEENRLFTSLGRDELIAEGYAPCENCNP